MLQQPSHGHDHAAPHANHTNERRVGWAALLTGGFMIAEVVGGIVSGSLALLADAGHMLTDAASLALAWGAFRVARRPATWTHTYGFDRLQVLVAFANGLALFAIAGWIVYEAAVRLAEPVEVLGGVMLAVALAGLIVNLAAFRVLHGAERDNLNIRGAMLHVLGDLLGSVAAIVAAAVIMATGWMPIDPLLSVLVALIILRGAWSVVRDSARILLEGAPADLDPRDIAADLAGSVPDVVAVHHIHAWSINQKRPMITLEATITDGAMPEAATEAIKRRLEQRFGVAHATVEVQRRGTTTPHHEDKDHHE